MFLVYSTPARKTDPTHQTSAQASQHNATGGSSATQLIHLRPEEWSHIGRFLSRADMQRIRLVNRHLNDIQSNLFRSVNEMQLARAIVMEPGGAASVSSPPALALRITGPVGHLAAAELPVADHIRYLDLRSITAADAESLIKLARLHPNAEIRLSREQQSQIYRYVLLECDAASSHLSRNASPADREMAIDQVTHCIPVNLLDTLTPTAATQLMRNSTAIGTSAAEGKTDMRVSARIKAALACSLLIRCDRHNRMAAPTRLFIARQALYWFPWNEPVSAHQKLFLITTSALAMRNGHQHDALTIQTLLRSIASIMDTEVNLRQSSSVVRRSRSADFTQRMTPEEWVGLLMNWGIDPHICNSVGDTVFSTLQRFNQTDALACLESACQQPTANGRRNLRQTFTGAGLGYTTPNQLPPFSNPAPSNAPGHPAQHWAAPEVDVFLSPHQSITLRADDGNCSIN